MDPKELERAFASTGAVLAGVTAAQLDEPTPCSSWKIRDLVNHIVGAARYATAMAETGHPAAEDGDQRDFAGGDDRVEVFNKAAADAVEAFSADGVMDRIMHLPFGDLPGSVFINIAGIDSFTHGWDLAKATGQPTDLDPGLATEMLAFAEASFPEEMRGPEPAAFGPRVEAPAGASPADRLAAFLGRHP